MTLFRGMNSLLQVHTVALVLSKALKRLTVLHGRRGERGIGQAWALALENYFQFFLTLGLEHCFLFISCTTVTYPSGLHLNLALP